MQNVVLGLIFIVGGVLMMYFYNQLYKAFGGIKWFEKNTGDGRTAYVFIGFALIVVGVLFMFGIGGGDPTNINEGFATSSSE